MDGGSEPDHRRDAALRGVPALRSEDAARASGRARAARVTLALRWLGLDDRKSQREVVEHRQQLLQPTGIAVRLDLTGRDEIADGLLLQDQRVERCPRQGE